VKQDTPKDLSGGQVPGGGEAHYRLLMECVQDHAIFLFDPGGRVTTWNAGAERILGYREEEILGEPVARFFTPEDVRDGEPEKELATATAAGRAGDDRWHVRKDGTRLWCSGTTTALRDEAGTLRGFAKVLRDRTAQKQAEEQLRQRNEELAEAGRRKDQFLTMLAHELRNPLAPILYALRIARQRGPERRSAVAQAWDIVERHTGHLTRIVNDLLEVSRITRGKIVLRPERLDLGRLVKDVSADHRPAFADAGLDLGLELPELPVWVSGDATRLTQVLDNFLNNAVRFTGRGGRVTVRLGVDADRHQAVLSVRDTGVGIAPDLLPRLFDAFAQADRSLDRSKGGLGLGLTLVRGLVELHGGEVQAASAGPGHGAEFTARLPAEPEPLALAQAPTPGGGAAKPLRILVVEDNRDAADSLCLLLRLRGHEVTVAYSGPAGVQAAASWHPDAVLCDIGLPGLDGYGVAGALRRDPATAAARMIAVTGYGRDDDRRRSREAGFDHHLTKPVEPEEVLQLLAGCRAGGG
jgi:PAS domain S-box-containing protein